ncbi:MAG: radical SAM protein, partial [Chitinivibrionales bacterium]|nr:radical SAM protein [Chitinivibrionales bacterium]
WSFKHALPFVNKKAALPPLGLLTIAPLLPAAWEKRLVDCNVAALKDKDLAWADYVLVSGMIVQKKGALDVISRAKAMGKFVIAGGPLFTNAWQEFTKVDCFVLNEGEVSIPLFLKDLAAGVLKRVYTSSEKPEIALSPIPDWSLIRLKDYATMAIQVSRGCPFNCEFCDIIVFNGRVPRVKQPERVIAEFNALYNAGWRGALFVVDDNFIGNKSKVTAILKEIGFWLKAKKRPFTLFTEASINLADDPEIMYLMQEANFNTVFVGIETPDEEGLKGCGKFQNTKKDLTEKVKILQRNGLQVQAGFIVGFDTDNAKTFENMIAFIQKSGIVTAMVGLLSALPETALYKRLADTGRILRIPSGNNTDFTLNFIPKMNAEVLIDGYKKVLSTIFAPKVYNKRIIVMLKEYRKFAKDAKVTFWIKLRVLTHAFWKLGVREKGRTHFWKLCLWTAVKRPALMSEALTLAIYGFHCRRVLIKTIN